MTGPDPTPHDPWAAAPGSVQPGQQQYGQQQYGQPPYGQPPYGAPAYGPGPLGQIRPTGKTVLLCLVTFGIYTCIYNYKVHDEMQRHAGTGLGGGIALVLTLLVGFVMPFFTASEVGQLHARRGQQPPVTGVTGLWFVLPIVVGYLLFFVTIFVTVAAVDPASGSSSQDPFVALFGLAFLVFVATALTGVVVWFRKVNGALNDYWRSLGAT